MTSVRWTKSISKVTCERKIKNERFHKIYCILHNSCKMIGAKLHGDSVVSLVKDDMIVNLCDTFAANNTHRGEQVMILDTGAPMSLAGRPWLD